MNKGRMEDPGGCTGCCNSRQWGYTSCVFGHSKCMASTAENHPVFSASHSPACGWALMMETVAILFHLRISPHPFSAESLLLSPIRLLPPRPNAHFGSFDPVHLPEIHRNAQHPSLSFVSKRVLVVLSILLSNLNNSKAYKYPPKPQYSKTRRPIWILEHVQRMILTMTTNKTAELRSKSQCD